MDARRNLFYQVKAKLSKVYNKHVATHQRKKEVLETKVALPLKIRIEFIQSLTELIDMVSQLEHTDHLNDEQMAQIFSKVVFRCFGGYRALHHQVGRARRAAFYKEEAIKPDAEIDWEKSLEYLLEDLIEDTLQEFLADLVKDPIYAHHSNEEIVVELLEAVVQHNVSEKAFLARLQALR